MTLRTSKSQITLLSNRISKYNEETKQNVVAAALIELETEFAKFRPLYEASEEPDEEYVKYSERFQNAKQHLLNLTTQPVVEETFSALDLSEVLRQQQHLIQRLADQGRSSDRGIDAAFVKLPDLRIPTFSGAVNEWLAFFDFFRSTIDENNQLSGIQKFQYLRSALSGEPEALIATIALSADNYPIAWDKLTNRYNKPYIVTRSLIQNIFDCKPVSADLTNFNTIINLFQNTIDSLDNRGNYAMRRDPWIIFLMMEKLDGETKKAWSKISAADDEPTLTKFLAFLERRRTELELSKLSKCFDSSPDSSVKNRIVKANAAISLKCIFCQGDHLISKCHAFMSSTPESREEFVSSSSRCYNCMGKGHVIRNCPSKNRCTQCQQKHHTLLHDVGPRSRKFLQETADSTTPAVSTEVFHSPSSLKLNSSFKSDSEFILPTVVVNIRDAFGRQVPVRALLDSGSQSSFISEAFVRRCGLIRVRSRIPISRLGDNRDIYTKGVVNISITSRFDLDDTLDVNAHILTQIIEQYPAFDVHIPNLKYLRQEFNFADPDFHRTSNIDVILGSSIFFEILRSDRYYNQQSNLYFQDTRFGFVACSKDSSYSVKLRTNMAVMMQDQELDKAVERFWETEEPPKYAMTLTDEERQCEEIFTDTVHRLSSGRFSVRLPFISNAPPLFGRTYQKARQRLLSLERKFSTNADFHDAYIAFMREYEGLGHMSRLSIPLEDLWEVNHFLIPHHGVFQKGKSIRVVFDGSAKDDNGVALNDCLHTGFPLQLNIVDVLLRFRRGRYALVCDVSKMFRQVLVEEGQRLFQLILWRYNSELPIEVFQLNTVTYGQRCAPFLVLRVLNELVERDGSDFQYASEIVLQNRYVDDFCFSDNSFELIEVKRDEVIQLLRRGGFELRKWATNDVRLVRDFPTDHVVHEALFEADTDFHVKTLGISWLPLDDMFTYQFTPGSTWSISKRQLLSETARLYDPLGWISPVVVMYKILVQEAWALKTSWDDSLPEPILSRWSKLRSEITHLQSIRIPRHLGSGKLEIHGFADASREAYAAVVYSRCITDTGQIIVRLLLAKTKLAPMKSISIPRLELCAAHLLSKLIPTCISALDISEVPIILWSDSKVVLAWLSSLPRRWSTFVSNRISDIHNNCPRALWHYVVSKANPADVASRGEYPSKFSSFKPWWEGPEFLNCPDFIPDRSLKFETCEEQRKTNICNAVIVTDFWPNIIARFSNFNRLIRSFAYLLRCVDFMLKRQTGFSDHLSTMEIKRSHWKLIRIVQERYFFAEFKSLRNGSSIEHSSNIRTLLPFIDKNGILRAHSRLPESVCDTVSTSPILLPRCYFSELLITRTHIDQLHAGPNTLCGILRQSYFIVGMLRTVKKIFRSCVVCSRQLGLTYQPRMGLFPEYRVKCGKPFAACGLDFAGPILVRPYRGRGNITLKTYIALFVCLSTKALHLELVMGLSVESLVMALRRFLARRGRCEVIWSDNGRNFVSCQSSLTEFGIRLQSLTDDKDLKDFLSAQLIEWRFIPRYSPTFGGIWEAGVRRVKIHLARCFSRGRLTVEELHTALVQIEGILNSRPLAPISMSDTDAPLTPSQLLSGHCPSLLPESLCEVRATSATVRDRQKEIQDVVRTFWKRWRQEYVPTLMRTPKWLKDSKKPRLGEVVLLKRMADPPQFWNFGKISKLYPGADGTIRVVDVITKTGVRRESLRNLVPLIIEAEASMAGNMKE